MLKRPFIFIILLVGLFSLNTYPVLAQFGPEDVYVDTSRDEGNEDGSKTKPYNTQKEGFAFARSRPDGANLYIRKSNGEWPSSPNYTYSVSAGRGGTPIPTSTLYLILAFVALALILLGWQLQRRSRNLQG